MELDRFGAELLFHVLTEQEEVNSVAIASNRPVAAFLKVSSLSRLTGALLSSESGTHRILLMGKLLVCVG